MAMIVQQDVYSTDASQSPAYSVGYVVTYEPKNPHLPYQANISVNGKVTAMMFFTDRAEALRYATNAQMQLWLLRSQPKPITVTVVAAQAAPDADPEEFSLEMEDGEPEEQHRSGDDCSCATCNPDPDDADEAEVARLEREFDEKHAAAWGYKSVEDMYEAMHREMEAEDAKRRERSTESLVERFYTMDDVGCVSRHPHLCRCGDCITYLAGE